MTVWTVHIGQDYAVVMRDTDTTETAPVRLIAEPQECKRLGKIIAAALNKQEKFDRSRG